MKTKNTLIGFGMMLFALLIVSCNKETQMNNDLSYIEQIVGNYTGTFLSEGLKSTIEAHADIQMNSDSSIWVHCYGGDIDTTFMFDLFNQGDSLYVCLTGEDFFNEYGHMRNAMGNMMNGFGSMMGGNMMGGNGYSGSDLTGWMHHLEVDHENGDMHFGGFDLNNHTFGYSFEDMGNNNMIMRFEGTKDND